MNHYETLVIEPSATVEQVKAAYRAAVKRAHPDAGGDAEAFDAVQQAFEILGHQVRRRDYDAHLALLEANRRLDKQAERDRRHGSPTAQPSPHAKARPETTADVTAMTGAPDPLEAPPPPAYLRPSDKAGFVDVVVGDTVYEVPERDASRVVVDATGAVFVTDRLFAERVAGRGSLLEWVLLGPGNLRLGRYRLAGAALTAVGATLWWVLHTLAGTAPAWTAAVGDAVSLTTWVFAAALVGAWAWPVPLTVGLVQRLEPRSLRWAVLGAVLGAAAAGQFLTQVVWWLLPAAGAGTGAAFGWVSSRPNTAPRPWHRLPGR
jgi:hypothetical protein